MKKGILEHKEGKWYIKWSDLHSFPYGWHWVWTPIHPDTNTSILKHGKEVEFEFSDMNIETFCYKYARVITLKQKNMKKRKTIKILNKSGNEVPKYATEGSAGLDLRANLIGTKIIKPHQRDAIPTGIYIELPENYEAQVRPRSGLALKYGVTVLNSPGTIDSDYREEIKVILINLSDEDFVIKNGDRIAQMIISKFEKFELRVVDKLDITDRLGGFGHTGIQ